MLLSAPFGSLSKDDGNENGKKHVRQQNNNFARASHFFVHSFAVVVCYTAVFRVVTQCSSPALRDDTKNGCVADYCRRYTTTK